MASIRFTSFILMFIVLHLRDSSAQSKALGKVLVTDVSELPKARKSPMNVEEEIYDGVPVPAEVGNAKLRGRKMMIKRALGMVKEESLIGDNSKIKGAAHSVVNCNHEGKGVLNVNCKLRKRGPKPMGVKMAGFVAFNADYHVPKSHPPKNN
uniref:BURP domain-containing protein n=1 Tax=Fagus sylvatica TaxID=28930 RepID=A0A2N9F4J5_FAGSY